jgi:glycosyltransferase involved in cell wall biosynthesis
VVRTEHHPARVAELYRDAIEAFSESSPIAHQQRLLTDISLIESAAGPSEEDLLGTAKSVAMMRRGGTPQLLLDVSATAQDNLKTGIERATIRLMIEFFQNSRNLRAEPTRFTEGEWRYARELSLNVVGTQCELEETPLEFHSGDVYLSLDWCPKAVSNAGPLFTALHEQNIPIYSLVYDLLPVLRPKMFPAWAEAEYRRWLTTLCEVADGLVCISRSVADELLTWLESTQISRSRPLRIGYFHLGADFESGVSREELPSGGDVMFAAMQSRPSFLMVGTVEPRKGHLQTLNAFEQLWEAGIDVNLVIVGKQGWEVDTLAERLRNHKETGRRLYWLPGVSDQMLTKLYGAASALLATSEGEGFGLPLIEAAKHKLPIVARDIPVFREVAAEHAFYFWGDTADALAAAIRGWLDLYRQGAVPASGEMKYLSWRESAEQLLEVVLDHHIYAEWPRR